ncbi:glycosyltransferase [Amycolatopsis sp. K13G38]|uniref:Glycosyltransferase n=1 Tax=Amycolatopsis acididurans TaxID=2724524 RepID=A0ABX1JGG5_9PSEU|nr:glycosyltransferase [Amycolatopsis acididurans]NKQ58888.1 glycosyltransferase [Amycolatopsis acididurans]
MLRRIRMPWVFAGLMVCVLGVMLILAGYASAGITSDNLAHDPVGDSTVPSAVRDGGPVVDATRQPVTARSIPDKTIALTFDDGPDPTWTPQVLSILRKYHVPATFFVVGSRASSRPYLLREIRDAGSAVGLHTFTHPDLVDVGQWRMDREFYETQLALAGAAGVTSDLFRPPYSSSTDALDDLGYRTVLAAGSLGYVSVFTNEDSEDWQRPGVAAIIANATPQGQRGSIVLMHDSGGDRSETVAALDRYIPMMQARGYRFDTVSGAVGLPPANQPAPGSARIAGTFLVTAVGIALSLVTVLQWILLLVGVLVLVRLALMVIVARAHARRRHDPRHRWGPPVTEPVSLIVPAYNERANIEVAIRSFLAGRHPLEVVVVDDGSTDGTADLVESLALPRVRVIRRENGGKAAALNTGIALARHDLVIMVDGDTVFEPDTVHLLVQPFADPAVGAVAGNVKVANRDGFLTTLQHIEYVVGSNVDRRVHDRFQSMPTVPGAAGAFRRSALLEVGGVSQETLAEDTDLTIALGRAGWRVLYEEHAMAWTEVPATFRQLWRQRYRWTYGTMQAVWKHRHAIVERGPAGRVGRAGLLHVGAFQVLLPVTAPLIDVFFVYGLFFLDPGVTLLLWSLVMAIQAVGAVIAFRLDGEPLGPLWLLPAQQLVYRQLMYLVLGQSLIAAAAGVRVRWQRMRRIGVLEGIVRESTPRPAHTKVAQVRAPVPASAPPAAGRERWLDLAGVLALSAVVVYHITGARWLGVIPSTAVLFGLGGSLMARSMRARPVVDVVRDRIVAILPPLWVFGLVLVPLMLAHPWRQVSLSSLAFWVVPVLDPPVSDWSGDAASGVWFARAALWFVLLTPLLVRAVRRRPVVALSVPLALVAFDAVLGSPLSNAGPLAQAILDFGTFGSCWVLGVAHREGVFRRVRPEILVAAAVLAAGIGVAWLLARSHASPDVNNVPLAQALEGGALVLVVLMARPPMRWLTRIPLLAGAFAAINRRTLTVFLWHPVAPIVALWAEDRLGHWNSGLQTGFTVLAVLLPMIVLGRLENLVKQGPSRRTFTLPERTTTVGG